VPRRLVPRGLTETVPLSPGATVKEVGSQAALSIIKSLYIDERVQNPGSGEGPPSVSRVVLPNAAVSVSLRTTSAWCLENWMERKAIGKENLTPEENQLIVPDARS